MARAVTLAGLLLGAALPACGAAYGQVSDQAAGSGWKVDARLTLAAAAMDDEIRAAPAAHGILADGDLTATRTDTLSNRFTGQLDTSEGKKLSQSFSRNLERHVNLPFALLLKLLDFVLSFQCKSFSL